MSIPEIEHCLTGVEKQHILLDTCFLIDYLLAIHNNDSSEYDDFITLLKKDNTLATVFPVAIELFKGSNLLSDFRKKKEFFDQIIDYVVPVIPDMIENSHLLTVFYRKNGKDISSTDYVLGAALMQYRNSGMLLLTRDHGDFPTKIFDRHSVIPIQLSKGGVNTYGLFKYSIAKEQQIVVDLIKADNNQPKL